MKLHNNQNLVNVHYKNKTNYYLFKQTFDFFISLFALFFFFPLFLVVSILIKIDSTEPVFYKQERIGMNGKPFSIIKFRTMYIDAEVNGPQWANQYDTRITKVGHYLRKYRIDELPQFINIVFGEMSLIGPRPERLVFIEEFEKELPDFRNRLLVKPGITGWAQIHGGYELSPKEKLELDLYYIFHCSMLLELKIMMKSVPVILFAKGWR